MTSPRVVFAMPAYNRPDTLAQTLESILSQSNGDFALIIVDDAPTEETDAIIARYQQLDGRITHERNPTRLGMVGNWRKCFLRARAAHPQSEYFAWVSDHDFWHPRWLEALVAELDAHPDVVVAYPQTLRAYPNLRSRVPRSFETLGIKDPVERVRLASERLLAGDTIYGLFRAHALASAGIFRAVMLPDRQVMLALAALGEFRQVPEVLWYRDVPRNFSLDRQRTSFFTGAFPLYTYLPWHAQHCGLMLWDFVLRGRGGKALARTTALRAAAAQFKSSAARHRRQREATDDEAASSQSGESG
jgi:glycosyltransferase involved in cell wall biosynthesis